MPGGKALDITWSGIEATFLWIIWPQQEPATNTQSLELGKLKF